MSGAWECTVRATQATSLEAREYECDLDRVAALGFVPRLGSAYIRWTASLKREDRRALEIEIIKDMLRLARKRRWRGADQVYYRMVELVLDELESPLCPTCGGRSMLGVDRTYTKADAGPARICPACNGARKRKYSDAERAAAVQVSAEDWRADWSAKFDAIRAALFKACGITRWALDEQLERDR